MRKYAEAELNYERALKIQPDNLNALHYLATAQEKIGGNKLEVAYENFSKIISQNPQFAPAYNGRGLVLRQT